MNDYLSKGEMPTFVDAYLYNIARRQGKWVGGIEDLVDQTGLKTDVVDKSDIELMTDRVVNGRSIIEEMIGRYTAQDLDAIDRMIDAGSSSVYKTNLLYRRNVKMARRMDSLSQQRTMFLAVGAAHLPGDSGVIRLLQTRGFTVSPVFSQHKLPADQYVFKEVPTPWYDVADAAGYYTASMPGNPATIKIYGLVETKFLLDIFNMAGYCTMAVHSVARTQPRDELLSDLAARMFNGRTTVPFKTINQDGVRGREYTQNTRGYPVRVRMFEHEHVVYIAMVYGFKKPALTSPEATRFFDSFKIDKAAPALVMITAPQRFTDSLMAVSVQTSAKLSAYKVRMDEETAEAYDIRTWTGVDAGAQAYLLLNVQAVREGYHITNDSVAIQENISLMETQYEGLTHEPYAFAGRKAVMLRGRNEGAAMRGIMIMRGNRRYLALALGDSANLEKPRIGEIFSSLQLLPYRNTPTSSQQDSAGTFSTLSPSLFRRLPATTVFSTTTQFSAYDTATSSTYTVSVDTLDPYAWYESDSAAWASKLDGYYTAGEDEILSIQRVKNGADEGREWTLRKPGATTRNRIRVIRHGRILYSLFASGDAEAMTGDVCNGFFEKFSALAPLQRFDWLSSKRDQLLADISSRDSTLRSTATDALRSAAFTRKDLPALHAAFLRTYPAQYSGGDTTDAVNVILGTHLATVADTSTLRFLREQYPRIPGAESFKRHAVVNALARTKTDEGYRLLASLLTKHPTEGVAGYDLRFFLRDSLPLLHTIYPQLLTLARDTSLGTLVASSVLELHDSGLVTIADLRTAEADFIDLSDHIVQRLRTDTTAYYFAQDLIRLLGLYNTAASTSALQEYYMLPRHEYYGMLALEEIIRAGGPADTAVLRMTAADPGLRLQLYRKLGELKRPQLFPNQYRTQRHFAHALVQEAAEWDDYTASQIIPLGTRVFSVDGASQRFYLFQVFLDDGEETSKPWLAVAGGFPKDESRVLPDEDEDITGVYYGENYEDGEEDELFRAFMRQVQERKAEAEAKD